MKLRVCVFLSAFVTTLLSAQERPVESGVRHLTFLPVGETVLPINGPTTDLAHLEYQQVWADVNDSATTSSSERLVIVDQGIVRVTVNGLGRVLGRGSVAVIMPGDPASIQNAGAANARYYLFTYRSKLPADSVRAKRAGGSFMVNWDDVVLNKTATGGVRRVFDRATAMLSRFEMHVSTLNQGLTNHPARAHRAEEMVVLLKGNVIMLLGESQQRAQTGDIAFLASQLLNSIDNAGKGEAEYCVFQWQP